MVRVFLELTPYYLDIICSLNPHAYEYDKNKSKEKIELGRIIL